jgi:hypothetical protein
MSNEPLMNLSAANGGTTDRQKNPTICENAPNRSQKKNIRREREKEGVF